MYTVWRAVTMMSVVDLVVYDGTYLSVCWLSAACVCMRCASRCVREAAIEMPWRDREVSCGVHRLRRVTCNRGGGAADVHNLEEITRRSNPARRHTVTETARAHATPLTSAASARARGASALHLRLAAKCNGFGVKKGHGIHPDIITGGASHLDPPPECFLFSSTPDRAIHSTGGPASASAIARTEDHPIA